MPSLAAALRFNCVLNADVSSEDMNRETHCQVTRDISRLLEQINDLSHMESEAMAGIPATTDAIAAAIDLRI